jgi:phosphoribosylformylglycinamidine synthase subunit PurS
MSVRARVLIRPKAGILDPQGAAVERALPALGFVGVEHVRIGRLVELLAPDAGELEAMCEKLLANPLIEEYEVEILAEERADREERAGLGEVERAGLGEVERAGLGEAERAGLGEAERAP